MTQTYITLDQLAERYQIRRATIYEWLKAGRLPEAMRIGGGDRRWKLDDLIRWETESDLRPPAEIAAIAQALLTPMVQVALLLRGATLPQFLEVYAARRAGCKTDAERATFFLHSLPDTLGPLMAVAPRQQLGDAACTAAVAVLSLALGDLALVADLVPPFAMAISLQDDVTSYLQGAVVRIREAREHRLSLPAIWLKESRLLFGKLAGAAADDLEMKQAVDAVLGLGVLVE